ncbi:MAG: trypsin-like peptidase domain-containing protein [Candidatus Andersenbacteria bacterium]|nr:trypsin-like peptidase domain-containing protein [Candidatus Andersenbacteria bacterium]MBI3250390.1 trypsin-like peptidase domain-containing protein [Candidatus Andersenbacteria bacterium]
MQNNFFSTIIVGALAGLVVSLIVVRTDGFRQPISIETNQNTSGEALPESAQRSTHERSVIEAVKTAEPAVVSIVITQDVPIVEQYFENVPSPFNNFFGFPSLQVPRLREKGTQEQEIGGGSGFLISADGMIVTNRHVVDQTEASYTVFLSDGTKHEATVTARDPVSDIAIMKIEGSNLPHLEFSDSSHLVVGQTVIAIGNALAEFQNTVSVGVVSGLARSIEAGDGLGQTEQLDEVIQTDAAINPGNSGGPLLDLTGKVIGVNVAMALGSENIGFAIPANSVKSIVDSVQETGKISRPYIGVRYVAVTPAVKEENNLSVDSGVVIAGGDGEPGIVPNSPAAKAGLTEGDVILEVDGQAITLSRSLATIIRQKKVGDSVSLKVLSNKQEKNVQVTLEEFPE